MAKIIQLNTFPFRFYPAPLPSPNFHSPSLSIPNKFDSSSKSFNSNKFTFISRSTSEDKEEYLIDAPVSIGDGFSFSGGKYSDGPSRSDEWFKQGKIVKAHPVLGSGEKAKDPIFGLTMGAGSQASADVFRWFCVESGSAANSPVILIHGFPSQAYSYRKVLPILSRNYHAIAFDWLGFGFSDKPQPKYGFDYTLDEYATSLESLLGELAVDNLSLVVQGFFAPAVVKYASYHQEKLKNLILVNPPLMDKHAKLPSTLSLFSNFLLGEIFSQDPLRASDKALTSCGPYMMKEEDAMVYRRPYLTSGSSGFALTAISRSMRKDLKIAQFRGKIRHFGDLTAHTSVGIMNPGYFLNPRFHYQEGFEFSDNIRSGVTKVIERLAPNVTFAIEATREMYVEEMRKMLSSQTWKVPTTICWGLRDRWLSYDGVEDFCSNLKLQLVELPGAGHHVQEDSGEELGRIIEGIIRKNS